ncbi:MAG: hypothetical protein ABH876_01560 [Patescibacteria group bacterium]|nr:hypothetical protein [Patescibacteria group bacterium]MBU1877092.1 hypothetical protein [Patescibacteria group bacterium]
MAILIAFFVFIMSLLGALIVVYQKIPILVNISVIEEKGSSQKWLLRIKNKIKDINFVKNFSYEIFLQKILSRVKVLTLKADNKTSNWLQDLREKYKKKKVLEEDGYWDKIKEKDIK